MGSAKDLRKIARGAEQLPDPLARLRYLRERTSTMPFGWFQERRTSRWKTVAVVSAVAAGLAATILYWRQI